MLSFLNSRLKHQKNENKIESHQQYTCPLSSVTIFKSATVTFPFFEAEYQLEPMNRNGKLEIPSFGHVRYLDNFIFLERIPLLNNLRTTSRKLFSSLAFKLLLFNAVPVKFKDKRFKCLGL